LLLALPASADEASPRQSIQDRDYPNAVVFTDSETCGKMIDLTPLYEPDLSAYELTPIGEMDITESLERVTSQSYDDDGNPITDVILDKVTRTRTTSQSYSYIADDGELRAVDVSCSFVCSGVSCDGFGCVASGTNCTGFSCHGAGCLGTCTKTSSTGAHPAAPDSKK
jgi:hypothetical protein